jgi:hypothetical protein
MKGIFGLVKLLFVMGSIVYDATEHAHFIGYIIPLGFLIWYEFSGYDEK